MQNTHVIQVVGGVAVTQSYYQHVLTTEGKVLEGEPCQLLITRLDETGLSMMPATQVCVCQENGSRIITYVRQQSSVPAARSHLSASR